MVFSLTVDCRLPTADFFKEVANIKNLSIFASLLIGTIAQLVEQRTENPCVAGSNPAGTTYTPESIRGVCFYSWC